MTRIYQYEDDPEHVERQQEQNDNTPKPDGQDHEGHGSFNFALMMIFFVGGCGAALAMVPIMVSCKVQTPVVLEHIYDIVYVVNSSFIGLLTLTCGYSLVRRRKWTADGHIKTTALTDPTFQNPEQLVSTASYSHPSLLSRSGQNSFPYAVVVFGIGSLLYRACQIVDTTNNFNKSSSFYSSTLYDNFHFACDILFLIGNAILVVFIVKFKHVNFRSCAYFHFVIALWIGSGLVIWFSIALSPVYVVITESCYNASMFDTGNRTTAKEVVETISSFLKPFYVEFVTICIGIFLTFWNKFYVDDLASRANSGYLTFYNQDMNGRSVEHIETETPESERRCGAQASNQKIATRRVIFIIPLIASFFFVVLYLVGHYINENQKASVYLMSGIRVSFHLFLLIFFVPICREMTKYKLRFKPSSLTCSEVVLIGTHTVYYVYFFFRFFATLSLLSSYEPNDLGNTELVFIMIYSGLGMVDIWCATYYILAVKNLQTSGRKITNLDKFGLTYNAAIHLAEWALAGLNHEWAPESTHRSDVPALAATFGDAAVRLVTLVVYPIIEFYRFHAAVVCFEIARDSDNY